MGDQGSTLLIASYLLVPGNRELHLFQRTTRSRRKRARSEVRERKQKTTSIMQNNNNKKNPISVADAACQMTYGKMGNMTHEIAGMSSYLCNSIKCKDCVAVFILLSKEFTGTISSMFTFLHREKQLLFIIHTCNNLPLTRRGRSCKPLVSFIREEGEPSGACSFIHYKKWKQDWQHCGSTIFSSGLLMYYSKKKRNYKKNRTATVLPVLFPSLSSV